MICCTYSNNYSNGCWQLPPEIYAVAIELEVEVAVENYLSQIQDDQLGATMRQSILIMCPKIMTTSGVAQKWRSPSDSSFCGSKPACRTPFVVCQLPLTDWNRIWIWVSLRNWDSLSKWIDFVCLFTFGLHLLCICLTPAPSRPTCVVPLRQTQGHGCHFGMSLHLGGCWIQHFRQRHQHHHSRCRWRRQLAIGLWTGADFVRKLHWFVWECGVNLIWLIKIHAQISP